MNDQDKEIIYRILHLISRNSPAYDDWNQREIKRIEEELKQSKDTYENKK